MQKFWIVWKDSGGVPTAKHFSAADARSEAERLARMHGGVFHVCEVVGSCKRNDVIWESYGNEVESIPF